jgi:hypothetical protein
MTGPPPGKPTVHVPVTIRLTNGTVDLDRLGEHVEDRTAAQLVRVIDLLDQRGSWEPTANLPDVEFTGAAARWSEDDKQAARAAVGTAMVRGARQARGGAGATHRSGAVGGRGGGGGTKPAPKPPPKIALRAVNTWAEFDPDGDSAGFRAAVEAATQAWVMATGRGLDDPYAVLFRWSGKASLWLWVAYRSTWVAKHPLFTPTWNIDDPKKSEPIELNPDATEMVMTLEPDGLKAWRDGAYKKATSAQQLHVAKKKGGVQRALDTSEIPAEAVAAARQRVDEYTKDWPTRIKVYYRLKIGGGAGGVHPFSHKRAPDMPSVPTIPVVALVDRQEAPASDTGELDAAGAGAKQADDGGGGGGGRGSGGDQGDGAGGLGAGGTGSDVTAPASQDVGLGGKGIVIAPEYKEGGSIFPMLPPDPNAKNYELACKPYDEELPVELLGPEAAGLMRPLIEEIARRLDMQPCEYPANFCLQAARMIRIRTSQVQGRFEIDQDGSFSTELVVGGYDESGSFAFSPYPSVAVQYLQHLAATIPMIRRLMELVRRYAYPKGRFTPHYWFKDVMDEGHQGCGLIWLSANQIMMQQLLNSSAYGVRQRHHNEEYTKVFAVLVKTHLAEQVETIMLRTALEQFIAIAGATPTADAHGKVYDRHLKQLQMEYALRGSVDERKAKLVLWSHGQDFALATRLSDETGYVFRRGEAAGIKGVGEIHATEANVWAIRASDGILYGVAELERQVQVRHQLLASIDPMLSQLQHRFVAAVRPLVDDPDQVPEFLDKLFTDMLAKNESVRQKNRADYEYAFEHAQIHKVDKDTPPAVVLAPTTVKRWTLTGIHALAHTSVGIHFKGDAFYENALDRLISQEYYWRSFAEDMIFIFGIAFTIICPPLGAALSFAANLALGIEKYGHAKEQEEIYGAVMNPEQVLDYAELQVELFMAKLQIGLSFLELIPGAGKGAKALTGIGKKAVQGGLKAGIRGEVKQLAKRVVMEELEKIAKLSAENFVKAFALELVEESIEDKIIDAVLGPVFDKLIKDLERDLHEQGLL